MEDGLYRKNRNGGLAQAQPRLTTNCCGKTQSAILPAVGALCDPDNPIGCALVVAPKREGDAVLRRWASTPWP